MEVLQTSPLATWVRRPGNFVPYLRVPRVSTRGSGRASARRSGGWRGWRTGSGLGLFLALLFFLLPLLERLHATLRFATLTDVALEGPSPCHGDHLRAPALLDANFCDPNPRSRPASRHRPALCRGAAILSSLKRSAIMSSPSAMKANGTDGGGAVEAVGRGSAVGRGEAHAARGGAGAPPLGAAGPPHSTGGRARRPGGAAARQRRAGAGEQAPGGGAEPDPASAADEVSRLQRRALHGEARRGAAPAAD